MKSWFGGGEFSQLLLVCNAFEFSFILNEILARYSNLGCRFFSFITLSISCHSLLACRDSVEKSAVSIMGISLYAIFCFVFVTFNIFLFVFNFCYFD